MKQHYMLLCFHSSCSSVISILMAQKRRQEETAGMLYSRLGKSSPWGRRMAVGMDCPVCLCVGRWFG